MLTKFKNHFIPHEGNEYAPHILQRRALFGMLGLVLLSFMIANFQALVWQGSNWLVGAVLPAVVTQDTNQERAHVALAPLTRSALLDQAAQLKADDMAKNSYFAHFSPSGVSPWYWFDMAGYRYTYAGENLAIHFSDSDAVVAAWMDSPAHRANITNTHYTEIGIGTARGYYDGYDTVFVVQLFGAPAMKSLLPTVPKQAEVASIATLNPAELTSTTTMINPTTSAPLPMAILGVETQVSSTTLEITPPTNTDSIETPFGMSQSLVPSSSETPTVAIAPKATTIDSTPQTVVDDGHRTLILDTMATATNLTPLPATISDSLMSTGTTVPAVARLATQPKNILQFLYLILGTLIAGSLFASVLIEWRRQHLIQVAYGVGLLVLMSGLFYIHVMITTGALVI